MMEVIQWDPAFHDSSITITLPVSTKGGVLYQSKDRKDPGNG